MEPKFCKILQRTRKCIIFYGREAQLIASTLLLAKRLNYSNIY